MMFLFEPYSPEHTNARVRRDSERSEGREGRTRHSSSGSGRGGPRPGESKSFTSYRSLEYYKHLRNCSSFNLRAFPYAVVSKFT